MHKHGKKINYKMNLKYIEPHFVVEASGDTLIFDTSGTCLATCSSRVSLSYILNT